MGNHTVKLRADKAPEELVEMACVDIAAMEEEIPFEYYEIDQALIKKGMQGTPKKEYVKGRGKECILIDEVLYLLIVPMGKHVYPWLVLSTSEHEKVIQCAHLDVGHMAMVKMLARV
jgi:hypothetical protein